MKTIVVTGSRDWADREALEWRLDREDHDTHFIDGGCPTGADKMVRDFCRTKGCRNSTMWAAWDAYKLAAGPIRNRWMLDVYKPDLVIAFPLPDSIGTVDCMKLAKSKGIAVEVVEPAT